MDHSTVFVGVDYATAFVQVCVLDIRGRQLANGRCSNDWQSIADFVACHGRHVRASIEACNGAADLAEELLSEADWSIDLAHPGYVARMKANPDKTDFSDARMLADLVRVGYLPRVWLAPQSIRELRRLVRYRQDLVKRRTALKLRIRALLRDHRIKPPEGVNPWTRVWWAWVAALDLPEHSRWIIDRSIEDLTDVSRRVEAATTHLEKATADDRFVEEMLAMSGIGLVTACAIRAEVGDPARFKTGRQLARFCGLSPQNASSGERQADAGLISACNHGFRAILIEAAHRLKRYDPRWARMASGLRARGKPGSVIAAAVANRWVRWLYHRLIEMRPAA